MSLWMMIFLIVLVSMAYAAFEAWLKYRVKGGSRKDQEALRAELDDMTARLQALEAIVTDSEYDLKRRIDALEDAPSRSVG